MTKLRLGFASFQKGDFELIVCDRTNFNEVVLTGQMEGNPSLEKISEVLPTCVYVDADSGISELPSGWFRMLVEATASLTPADDYVDGDADGHLLEAAEQLSGGPAQDDDCKLYLFTQSQLLKLMRTLTQKEQA
jgi:hypothetical protein